MPPAGQLAVCSVLAPAAAACWLQRQLGERAADVELDMQSDAEGADGGLEAAQYLELVSSLRLGLIVRRRLGFKVLLMVSVVGSASALLLSFCNGAKAVDPFANAHCYAYARAMCALRSTQALSLVRLARCLTPMQYLWRLKWHIRCHCALVPCPQCMNPTFVRTYSSPSRLWCAAYCVRPSG